ncbi:MAG: ketol-acid reductoisomerase [Armatimonadia bacterium]|nr:ketol-acid reductoisomerase [Armatimonadia bacterium]
MAKIYYDQDASFDALKDRTVGVIGYGIQGEGQAQNLRDSGVNVLVAEKAEARIAAAKEVGLEVGSADEVAKKADVIVLLTQDHLQASIYRELIAPHMSKGEALVFSHGFNIHYGQIQPPADIDVLMVAPKGPGALVREQYLRGAGVPALLAIHQDSTGNAKELGLAYAKGIGGTRGGVIETSFREETETDLFGEQSVLCGGAAALITAAYETLVEAGYQPEMAYFECCHELKLICDLIFKYGIAGMRRRVSDTAEFGDLSRGPRIIDENVRETLREILAEIQNGEFAREWILENQAGRPVYTRLRNQGDTHEIERIGKELRDSMPWLQEL